jgi:hypothetical protein
VAEGSDYIKIIVGNPAPSLQEAPMSLHSLLSVTIGG